MTELAKYLKSYRAKSSYANAKQFFLSLSKKAKLDFNYAYYARIESGQVTPSAPIVAQLARLIDKPSGEGLISAYCADLFPRYSYLFAKESKPLEPAEAVENIPAKQELLSPAQIACIAFSKDHYFLFLLLTLARGQVPMRMLQKTFKADSLKKAVSDLEFSRLVYLENDSLKAFSSELKFPPADSEEDKKTYKQLDQWDQLFSEFFGFNIEKKKMILRRISPRYFTMILAHCDLMIDLIKSSEEIDSKHNTDVVQLSLVLSTGKLPG